MEKIDIVAVSIAILGCAYLVTKMDTNNSAPQAQQTVNTLAHKSNVTDVRQEAIDSTSKDESNKKIIRNEQDSQASRCKNGYSDGCDKERAIADFMKATGQ